MSIYPTHKFKIEDLLKDNRTTLSNIEEVKKWLQNNPNIPDMSLEQISLFLMACNNDVEYTQRTISCYFKYKSEAPELFCERDLDREDLQQTLKVMGCALFPTRTKEGYCVALGKLKDTYYYNYDLTMQIKLMFMLLDLALNKNPPYGIVFAIDLKGVGIMHLTKLKIGLLKKFFQFLQEALPTQLKEIHILNSSYVFDKMLMLSKPFMNQDLYHMIRAHPGDIDMDEFFEKHIPRDCMPVDYGGTLPCFETLCSSTYNEMKELKTYFELDQQQTQMYKP